MSQLRLEYSERYNLDDLYHCPSFKDCAHSCTVDYVHRTDKIFLGGPMGAYIGNNYRKGGVMIIAINPNKGQKTKPWDRADDHWFNQENEEYLKQRKLVAYKDDLLEWWDDPMFRPLPEILNYLFDKPMESDQIAFQNIVRCSHNLDKSQPTAIQFSNCVHKYGYILRDIEQFDPHYILCIGGDAFYHLRYSMPDVTFRHDYLSKTMHFHSDKRHVFLLPHLSQTISVNIQQKKYREAVSDPGIDLMSDFYKELVKKVSSTQNYKETIKWWEENTGNQKPIKGNILLSLELALFKQILADK